MSDPLHVQLKLKQTPGPIYQALTEGLSEWFAEHSEVSIPESRYDFWGRYTPDTPTVEQGRHPLQAARPGQALQYGWLLDGAQTTVRLDLVSQQGQTIVAVSHHQIDMNHDIGSFTYEDFWFLSLENLRRHLDGKPIVRCDFSKPMVGDIQHSLEIDAAPAAVYDALLRPEQINRWIASAATVETRVGGVYSLGWEGFPPAHILELVPDERLSLSWPEEKRTTTVTWTLEGSGGKTRLTILHSGFAPDEPTGGLNAGWLNFINWVRSVVEYGAAWQPPIKKLAPGMEPYYAGSIGRAQAELIPLESL
jgi:uncharacterized protein YndB with AHSA1/START domain